jgi:hypothetical protein
LANAVQDESGDNIRLFDFVEIEKQATASVKIV